MEGRSEGAAGISLPGVRDLSIRFLAGVTAAEFRQKAGTELSAVLSRRGWNLKQQQEDHFVWERRYWPPVGWIAFLAILVFGLPLAGSAGELDSQSSDIQWFVILLWVGLLVGCALIRKTATLYLTIGSQDNRAVVSFGGQADRRTAKALGELAEGMPAPEGQAPPLGGRTG